MKIQLRLINKNKNGFRILKSYLNWLHFVLWLLYKELKGYPTSEIFVISELSAEISSLDFTNCFYQKDISEDSVSDAYQEENKTC